MLPSNPALPTPDHAGDGDTSESGEQTPFWGTSKPGAKPVRRVWMLCAVAAVLAGLVSWQGSEWAWKGIRAAQTPKIVPFPTAEDRARVIRGLVARTAVSFIQQGTVLAAMLGIAGCLARRALRAAIPTALSGAVLGAVAAAAAAYLLLPIYFLHVSPQGESLALPLMTHGGIWAAIGAASGLALAIGLGDRGRWPRAFLGGLLGGVAGAVIYDLVGAIAFPLDKTSQPVSATIATRLFAQITAALCVAVGASFGAAGAPEGTRATFRS
jgi:hypothetical protein